MLTEFIDDKAQLISYLGTIECPSNKPTILKWNGLYGIDCRIVLYQKDKNSVSASTYCGWPAETIINNIFNRDVSNNIQ